MDFEQAKSYLRQQEPTFLAVAPKKVNRHTTYVCPNEGCGNGSGSDGTGIALIPASKSPIPHYKCPKCGMNEDIIGLWMKDRHQENFNEAVKELCEYYRISLDDKHEKLPDRKKKESAPAEKVVSSGTEYHSTATESGNIPYYRECAARVGQTEYFHTRGLSENTIKTFLLGYDPAYHVGKDSSWKAVIIPTGPDSFVVRNTGDDPKQRYRNHGDSKIFNLKALKQSEPVFVVEGEIDALCILEAGYQAVGLGSTSNYVQLLKELEKENNKDLPLFIALDNDDAGQKTSQNLCAGLNGLHLPYAVGNIFGAEKDAGDAWVRTRAVFSKELESACAAANQVLIDRAAAEEKEKQDYIANSAGGYLQDFCNGIKDSVNTPFIPTGYAELDKVLGGGLYEGLYFVGAISSLGKTTYVLQMADQIAMQGKDVLIFSLEMAKSELIAKSISRLTSMYCILNDKETSLAKTNRGITTGSRWKNYSQDEIDVIQNAFNSYGEYANHIYIQEGIGNIGVEQVREAVQHHMDMTGNKPVVVIDYVQILAPSDIRATDKQNTDKAVLELKRKSRDYKIPVIGISSLNRGSYNLGITMSAFKESGRKMCHAA